MVQLQVKQEDVTENARFLRDWAANRCVEMVFDSKLIEAKFALKRIAPDQMPSLAWDALEAGLDGPSIRRLAALLNPSGWEIDQIVPSFMRDAGLTSITRSSLQLKSFLVEITS